MDGTFTSQALVQEPANYQKSLDERCEYLAFRLGAEDYGIQIHCIQEIRSFEQPTHIATAPDHILGVRNLRGVIVPIVDMRVKFGKSAPIYDAQTVTIVLAVGNRVIGMVVDSVSDVVELAPDQIKAAPEIGGELSTDYITGIGSIEQSQSQDNRMLVLLDIEKFMQATDTSLVKHTVQ